VTYHRHPTASNADCTSHAPFLLHFHCHAYKGVEHLRRRLRRVAKACEGYETHPLQPQDDQEISNPLSDLGLESYLAFYPTQIEANVAVSDISETKGVEVASALAVEARSVVQTQRLE
jgi:hypothetical protein